MESFKFHSGHQRAMYKRRKMTANERKIVFIIGALLVSFILGCISTWFLMTVQNRIKTDFQSGEAWGDRRVPTDYSFTSVSVLCWVMTSPENLFERAIHISQTWGPRCNLTLYVTSEVPDHPFPGRLLTVPVGEGRHSLWNKTRAAFTFIYTHYRDKYDWFVKADDDTFIIVDNLRYFLASKDPMQLEYYGFHLRLPPEMGYAIDFISGGAGYVMGKETLQTLIKVVFDDEKCHANGEIAEAAEDVMMAHCLREVGITIGHTLDSLGKHRFLVFKLTHFIYDNIGTWLPSYLVHNLTTGIDCCSPYLISMHYVRPPEMYFLEYVTQRLRLASLSKDHNYHFIGNEIPI
ncbi:Glycoprotein-N-acetylgalactosamine 3-beta-galactosyltransferase 1 [Holothuria leucospilota]|uniref:N-acetylgalactosaminide beta-1,3-galactosyltransferase n=1 Tax=Holothuria leucospilota TaxID=206669 RepID=A0A9Q1BFI5_HOLLE|nr:Glycoprotein-N-acetylgalactosamine 3-beta-galactosyltransferase 1 [Holothuria leucospilota]